MQFCKSLDVKNKPLSLSLCVANRSYIQMGIQYSLPSAFLESFVDPTSYQFGGNCVGGMR